MCRYDDDFEWYVGGEWGDRVADVDRRCEDCGRVIPAGEVHTEILEDRSHDDEGLLFVAFNPADAKFKYVRAGEPFIVISEDDIDVWEALGFQVDEDNHSWYFPPDPVYHYCCNHCRAADLWLREVCDQHVVFVTSMDLHEHRHEYTDEQLGPDFVTLDTLCSQQWRSKLTGELIPVPVIGRLARDAAEYALAGGLVA